MKARRLIQGSHFEPEVLSVISEAFESAWREIAVHFGTDPRSIESARLRLAHACLIVAREDSNDPARLKREALQVMAVAYKQDA